MAYGIKILGGSAGNIILADTDLNASQYVCTEFGTGSQTSGTIDPRVDLIFFRFTPPAGTNSTWVNPMLFSGASPITQADTTARLSPANVRFVSNITRATNSNTFTYVYQTVEYMIFKPARTSTINNGSTYGLRLVNSAGFPQYDTRLYTQSRNIRLDERFTRSPFGITWQPPNSYRDNGPYTNSQNLGGLTDWYCANILSTGAATVTNTFFSSMAHMRGFMFRRGASGGLTEGVYAGMYQLTLAGSGGNYATTYQSNAVSATPDFAVFKGTRLL